MLQSFSKLGTLKQTSKFLPLLQSNRKYASFDYATILNKQQLLNFKQVYNFSNNQANLSPSSKYKYVRGFRNTFALEIAKGYLPSYTNPKVPPHNLVTEQLTGPQGFTGEASGGGPLRTWLYKRERSLNVGTYYKSKIQPMKDVSFTCAGPNPLRFLTPQKPTKSKDFLESLVPFCENDHIYYYQYNFTDSMSATKRVFHNTDGEMLVQPSVGTLKILTEQGILELPPGYIGVIPKNLKFQINVDTPNEQYLGVITELKNDRSFRLPHRGPIGANGLANPENFESPIPFVDETNLLSPHKIICKMNNVNYEADYPGSPFDVYAWKGNYSPYRFNLEDFVPIIAGQRDHLDPSSHIVLAVGAADGGNFVELVVFVPRFNLTTDKYPTYLPPYDHRNNGKSEIMHYLGGYDAREGTEAGYQTVHTMGVAHGNDAATFKKSRSGNNEILELKFPPATMLELTNSVKFSQHAFSLVDPIYMDQLRGTLVGQRPKEAIIGGYDRIEITAFEQSVVPTFDALFMSPINNFNENTGLSVKEYKFLSGQTIQVNSQNDQNQFWNIFKSENNANLEKVKIPKRNPSKANNQQLKDVFRTMKLFFNRGTVVESVNLQVSDPAKTTDYFIGRGLSKGREDTSLALSVNSPLNFKFTQGTDHLKNQHSRISAIDHTVINVYQNQLKTVFELFPEEFWGGDPRDLRATGVQFYTRVLTSNKKQLKHLIPLNNLDETEEQILQRLQDGDTYLPPYIRDAALGNQITRGLYDTNKTSPKPSKDGFLQHIAMLVNPKFGDLADHLNYLKEKGVQIIPSPGKAYYELSEIDLSQRVVLIELYNMLGYDIFKLPGEYFNALLKPKDANISRLEEILKKNNCSKTDIQKHLINYNQIQPVLKVIGESVLNYTVDSVQNIKSSIEAVLGKQNINFTADQIRHLIELIRFNKKKIQRAEKGEYLIDFQLIQPREESGYLDQTFSVPLAAQIEGTVGLFLEFISRTCYDEIPKLISSNTLKPETSVTSFKSCGAFGQGNFQNLMDGQQKGIDLVQRQRQQQKQMFELPKLDLDTINSKPFEHLYDKIKMCQQKGETTKVNLLNQITENMKTVWEECQKRNIVA